jgi:hypothetical protein
MISYAVQPILPLASDGDAMARVLHHAGIEKDHQIWVTGPAGLAGLLWLDRHGYRGASYVQLDRLGAMRPADAVLIPHACAPREVADLLREATCLRESGALVVQVAGELSAETLGDIPLALEPLGFRVQRRLYEKGRTVCIARREGRPRLSVAA